MRGEDVTRDLGSQMQRGVKDAKVWELGPLTFARTIYPDGTAVSVMLRIGPFCLKAGGSSTL